MEKKIEEQLRYLKLFYLMENWNKDVSEAEENGWSLSKLFKHILNKEEEFKRNRARLSRIKGAKIPIEYAIETYPFQNQPHLNQKRLLAHYESLSYIHNKKNMILMGPTGSGKTGLATSFLLNAINAKYRGKFILFSELIENLWASKADNTTKVLINKYASYDCLLVDELGLLKVEEAQVGLFFTLMQKRYKKTCTIITTNLGFKEWEDYLGNRQLAAALIDRMTDNGLVINMRKCNSIRSDAEVD